MAWVAKMKKRPFAAEVPDQTESIFAPPGSSAQFGIGENVDGGSRGLWGTPKRSRKQACCFETGLCDVERAVSNIDLTSGVASRLSCSLNSSTGFPPAAARTRVSDQFVCLGRGPSSPSSSSSPRPALNERPVENQPPAFGGARFALASDSQSSTTASSGVSPSTSFAFLSHLVPTAFSGAAATASNTIAGSVNHADTDAETDPGCADVDDETDVDTDAEVELPNASGWPTRVITPSIAPAVTLAAHPAATGASAWFAQTLGFVSAVPRTEAPMVQIVSGSLSGPNPISECSLLSMPPGNGVQVLSGGSSSSTAPRHISNPPVSSGNARQFAGWISSRRKPSTPSTWQDLSAMDEESLMATDPIAEAVSIMEGRTQNMVDLRQGVPIAPTDVDESRAIPGLRMEFYSPGPASPPREVFPTVAHEDEEQNPRNLVFGTSAASLSDSVPERVRQNRTSNISRPWLAEGQVAAASRPNPEVPTTRRWVSVDEFRAGTSPQAASSSAWFPSESAVAQITSPTAAVRPDPQVPQAMPSVMLPREDSVEEFRMATTRAVSSSAAPSLEPAVVIDPSEVSHCTGVALPLDPPSAGEMARRPNPSTRTERAAIDLEDDPLSRRWKCTVQMSTQSTRCCGCGNRVRRGELEVSLSHGNGNPVLSHVGCLTRVPNLEWDVTDVKFKHCVSASDQMLVQAQIQEMRPPTQQALRRQRSNPVPAQMSAAAVPERPHVAAFADQPAEGSDGWVYTVRFCNAQASCHGCSRLVPRGELEVALNRECAEQQPMVAHVGCLPMIPGLERARRVGQSLPLDAPVLKFAAEVGTSERMVVEAVMRELPPPRSRAPPPRPAQPFPSEFPADFPPELRAMLHAAEFGQDGEPLLEQLRPELQSRGGSANAALRRRLMQTDGDFRPEDYEMLLELDGSTRRAGDFPADRRNLVQSFPVSKLTKNASTERCTICLDDMVPGCKVKTLPCMHVFHAKCIDKWLKQKGPPRCPVDQLRVDQPLPMPPSSSSSSARTPPSNPPANSGGERRPDRAAASDRSQAPRWSNQLQPISRVSEEVCVL